MITGNKGEWSEIYALIKILAEGKLYQSDLNLNIDNNCAYEVIKAYKSELDFNLEFIRNDTIQVYKVNGKKELIHTITVKDLVKAYNLLLNGINNGKGKSFRIIEIEGFLKKYSISKIKTDNTFKADIQLRVYDHRLAKETDLGFSIKSLLGSDSTLFNTGAGNNFIYRINKSNKLVDSELINISEFNSSTYLTPKKSISKLTYRLEKLSNAGFLMDFDRIQSKQLWKNLKMVDGDLPEILAHALTYRWIYKKPNLIDIANLLEEHDPMNFYNGEKCIQKLYVYKLKKFLAESAMGMTSERAWLGEYDTFGGVIIVKNDGDVVCFHIYDFNLFRDYLINNTRFEQASTGEDNSFPGTERKTGKKYYYGWLYEENESLWFKLNLQIRFK